MQHSQTRNSLSEDELEEGIQISLRYLQYVAFVARHAGYRAIAEASMATHDDLIMCALETCIHEEVERKKERAAFTA